MGANVNIQTSSNAVIRYIKKSIADIRAQAIIMLARIGEECVNTAKNSGRYTDRTGNLRSSIGYMVLENGSIINVAGFGKGANQTLDGQEGAAQGEEYIQSIAAKFPKGLTLVLVAGMKYAAYVNDRGYDVLDSAETVAESLVAQIFD